MLSRCTSRQVPRLSLATAHVTRIHAGVHARSKSTGAVAAKARRAPSVDSSTLALMRQAMRLPGTSGIREHEFHSSARTLANTTVKPFLLADIGEGITECEIVKWNVEVGQVVEEFDPIVEVMSDKATVEISSPFAGKVISLNGAPGDVVRVGKNLCEIEMEGGADAGESAPASAPADQGQTASLPPTGSPTPTATTPASTSESTSTTAPSRPSPSAVSDARRRAKTEIHASPATRRVARENQVDLANVTGTGPQGRVTKADVLDYVSNSSQSQAQSSSPEPASTKSSPAPSSGTHSVPLSSVRKAMFRGMTATLQIPHFSYSETLDVTGLERLRLRLNQNIPLTHRRTLKPAEETQLARLAEWGSSEATERVPEPLRYDRMTLLPLLIKALSLAMAQNPLFSCSLSTSPEPALLRRASHDISIALSAPSGGLYTPLLPAVDQASPYSLASSIAHLLHCSTTSSPPKFPDANKGAGTITLSNVGVVGGTTTHPIIPPTGQLAIGALGRMRVEPRYVQSDRTLAKKVAQGLEAADSELRVEPRLLMDVTFSADHRVVEGVELAKLVETWKRLIEEPELLIGLGK